jgi:hypothetical protein
MNISNYNLEYNHKGKNTTINVKKETAELIIPPEIYEYIVYILQEIQDCVSTTQPMK